MLHPLQTERQTCSLQTNMCQWYGLRYTSSTCSWRRVTCPHFQLLLPTGGRLRNTTTSHNTKLQHISDALLCKVKIKRAAVDTAVFSTRTEHMYRQTRATSQQWLRSPTHRRMRLKSDGTRAENNFRLPAKQTSPLKSVGASVQSTTGSRGVRISGSNIGYTLFLGSVKSTGYPRHSPVSPSLPLPWVTVCHHISTGLYHHLPGVTDDKTT
jgi:hypothetical protein